MKELSAEEREIYRWQMWIPQLAQEGQKKLRHASVLVTRVGGVGGTAALYLAAAGVGRIVLAHAGEIKLSDLHRQVLMKHGEVGQSRVKVAAERLRELNPHVEVEAVGENVSEENVSRLVGGMDLVVDAAPRFEERLLYPSPPKEWKREFPVLGAVAGMIGCLGAVEAIKVLAGMGKILEGRMLLCDLEEMSFRMVELKKNGNCAVCKTTGEVPVPR